jgi:hypothetical protein
MEEMISGSPQISLDISESCFTTPFAALFSRSELKIAAGQIVADARDRTERTRCRHDTDDWPYLAENLAVASVLARGAFKSNRASAIRRWRRQ